MRKTKAIEACLPCLVLRDQRERPETRWNFAPSQFCAGTKDCHLATGDYTLQGFEDKFVIERKASVNDFVCSMAAARFKEELIRMSDYPHAFLILEFTMGDLYHWPQSANVPSHITTKLPLGRNGAAFAKYMDLRLAFPYVDFIFADKHGKILAGNIFKRIIEAYAKTKNT